jgi:catechol 2,3-dioxygenase
MTTLPLHVDDLLGELDDPMTDRFEALPIGTVMGHVHLKVADIAETVAFYRDVLGLAVMAQIGAQAVFLSAGGYHHHVGANTWESAGAPPAPPGSAALRHATLVFESAGERDHALARVEESGQAIVPTSQGSMIRDPSGNAVALITRAEEA